MSNSEENKSEEKRSYFIHWLLGGAVGVFISVTLLFFYINKWTLPTVNDENNTLSNLGTIGDYFGGLINPLLGFVSFFALLYTIQIQMKSLAKQSEELELTRAELRATKEELARSAKAQEQSSAIFKKQQFETTFFSLVNQLNKEIERFGVDIMNFSEEDKSSKIYGNKFVSLIKRISTPNHYMDLDLRYKPVKYVKVRLEEQIGKLTHEMNYLHSGVKIIPELLKMTLRFIDFHKIENQEFYVNIIKSGLNKEILYMLSIIGYKDKELYKYILEYEILEFMPFRFSASSSEFSPILRLIVYEYDSKAFGTNIYLQDVKDFEESLIKQYAETINAN